MLQMVIRIFDYQYTPLVEKVIGDREREAEGESPVTVPAAQRQAVVAGKRSL